MPDELDALAVKLGVSVERLREHWPEIVVVARKRKTDTLKASDFKLEGAFNCDAVRDAIDLWLKYKREKGQGYKGKTGINSILNKFKTLGPGVLIEQIRVSIEANYAGVFLPRNAAKQADDWHAPSGMRISEMTTAQKHQWKIPYKAGR